jgi:uncharacterized membrane protein YeaQ/YmgE (transglycosylase-associated protein family)
MSILWWILVGIIVGAVARLAIPGPTPMGWIITIVIGIVGAIIGGYIATAIGTTSRFLEFILAVLVAVALCFGYGALTRRRGGVT